MNVPNTFDSSGDYYVVAEIPILSGVYLDHECTYARLPDEYALSFTQGEVHPERQNRFNAQYSQICWS